MDPTTGIAIAVSVAALAGFGAGWGLKPDAAVKALEAQTEAIETLNKGNSHLVERVTETALVAEEKEASIAAKLTDVPPQCLEELGGHPLSVECAWAWCVRTGSSDRQRCESAALTTAMIAKWSCPEEVPP